MLDSHNKTTERTRTGTPELLNIQELILLHPRLLLSTDNRQQDDAKFSHSSNTTCKAPEHQGRSRGKDDRGGVITTKS
jgi:hypothetical protein